MQMNFPVLSNEGNLLICWEPVAFSRMTLFREASYPTSVTRIDLACSFDKSGNIYYVYWTVHHLDSWVKRDQLDVTLFIISLYNAQHVSDVNTSILRSLRLICRVVSWVTLIWFDVCWCYVMVWLWWCGIRMQAEALLLEFWVKEDTDTTPP